MIKSFRHKGLELFFRTGSKAGVQPAHANRLRMQLGRLDSAVMPEEMNLPGWRLHSLSQNFSGRWAVWVNGNWRMTFAFEKRHAILVDYQDYH